MSRERKTHIQNEAVITFSLIANNGPFDDTWNFSCHKKDMKIV
jgi:hypothetical protein